MEWANQPWPPNPDDETRLARYKRYQQLFEGDHATAFEELGAYVPRGRRRKIIYITANYAGLITKLAADLLFSERPVFVAPEESAQANLDRLLADNDFYTLCYEMALSTSFRGDGVFRVRKGLRHLDDREQSIIIEEIPAYSYFVQSDPDNVRTIRTQAVAWLHRTDNQDYLRVEEHQAGLIRQRAFRYNRSADRVMGEVSLETIYGDAAPPVEEETGIDKPLLVHVPNFRHSSRLFGMSDYYDLESLFDSVNNRLSKTETILDRHANPKLALPPGALDERGNIRVSDLEVFEGDPAFLSNLPRYITWDAKLESSFKQLEHLLDQIFRLAEISPAAFGLDKAGSIESGRAMRMRFIHTQAKIARKRQYFDAAIRRVLMLAQEMEQVHFGGPEPVMPSILWQDGIPDDMMEMVDIETKRVEAGLAARKTSLQRLDKLTEQQAEEELQRIREESAAPTQEGEDTDTEDDSPMDDYYGEQTGQYPQS